MEKTVNRIYQGKIVNGELKGSNNVWRKCNWQTLLQNHHILFQSAVNYYLLCFMAMATNKKRPSDDQDCPIFKLREQMCDKWENFIHKGIIRQGMKQSFSKYLPSIKSGMSFDDACKKILEGNYSELKTLHKALTSLLKHCSGSSSIQQQGRAFAPVFFDQGYSGNQTFKEGEDAQNKKIKFEQFRRDLWNDSINPAELAEQVNIEDILNVTNGKSYSGTILKQKLKKSLESLKQHLQDKDINQEKVQYYSRLIDKKIQKGLTIPAYRGGGKGTGKKSQAFILFKYIEANEITRFFLKKTIRKLSTEDNQIKEKKSVEVENESKGSKLAVNGKDPLEVARGKRGYIIPSFTALLREDQGKLGNPLWKEFDIAAFKEALTVVHQINKKTKERESKKQKHQEELDMMEKYPLNHRVKRSGIKKRKNEQEDEKEICFIGKFKWNENKKVYEDEGEVQGDPRIKLLRKLLEQDLAQDYFGEDDGVGKIPYGLRKRTIRGFNELRKKWHKKSKNKPFSEELKQKLEEELKNYQKKNKYGIGSTPLFKELLDKDNWIVWKELNEQKQYAEQGFPVNPLEALCDWYDLKENIEKLSKPIQFTPADSEHSRRLFRFGDACSWPTVKNGTKRGEKSEYGHDKNSLSVRVPIILRVGKNWKKDTVKLHYSAPRLFRDSLRQEFAESLESTPWLQPMMKVVISEPIRQDFWSCNLQLMPDKTRHGEWRYLLNFPLKINIECLKISKSLVDWEKNCNAGGNKYLKWPRSSNWEGDERIDKIDWFNKTNKFRCLSVDLGQRTAGAFAVISAENTGKLGRYIGSTGNKQWYANVQSTGVLRLPGEDMKCFQKGILKTEPYGSKGRNASSEELECTKNIILKLCGKDSIKELIDKENENKFSFPELNDKLLVAVRRSQGLLSQYYRWAWMLNTKDSKYKEKALKEIREQAENQEWTRLASGEDSNIKNLRKHIKQEIFSFQEIIESNILQIANRILPLRGRKWEWIKHPQKNCCHLLKQTEYGTDKTDKKLHGQRGLSMKRIEQIEELRRRFQSLNQIQRRQPGDPPLTWTQMRKHPVPDSCPDLLKKLEEIKKQRVNQTAHLILAEALGVRLKAPSLSQEERCKKNIHGEYEKIRDPVDFIVIEDLSRYRMKQDRTSGENSRLMNWSHRAVTNKLNELCEPYRIPVLEATAAYSSKFCSRSGVPGFRAEEVTIRDEVRWPYRKWLNDKGDEDERKRSEFLKNLFFNLEGNNKKTGLVPKIGGPIFVPIKNYMNTIKNGILKSAIQQADINAAINIGLRAIASPLVEEIHHRVRSEWDDSKNLIVKRSGSIERRRFKKKEIEIIYDKKHENKNLETPNFFIDLAGVGKFDEAQINGHRYSSGKAVWTSVNNEQWNRCQELNKKEKKE